MFVRLNQGNPHKTIMSLKQNNVEVQLTESKQKHIFTMTEL